LADRITTFLNLAISDFLCFGNDRITSGS